MRLADADFIFEGLIEKCITLGTDEMPMHDRYIRLEDAVDILDGAVRKYMQSDVDLELKDLK